MVTRLLSALLVLFLMGCGGGSGGVSTTADASGNSAGPQPSPSPTVNPIGKNLVLVADRADGTVSVINADTETVTATVALPTAANPSRPGYIVYSKNLNRVYVGDSGNSRIVVFDGNTLTHLTDLPIRSDAFHMWESNEQLWVVDRVDRSVAVYDLNTNGLLTVIPVPADLLALGGVPHDVVVDAANAYLSIQVPAGVPDVVVKFSRASLSEVGRAQVGDDPHLILHPTNRNLYVACQDTDNVFELDRDTMAQLNVVPILGGHGVWIPPHGQSLYVTNTPRSCGWRESRARFPGAFRHRFDDKTSFRGASHPVYGPSQSYQLARWQEVVPHPFQWRRSGQRLRYSHADLSSCFSDGHQRRNQSLWAGLRSEALGLASV